MSSPTVAVTGAAGPIGTLVTQRLVARIGAGIGAVIAVDSVRGTAVGATWRVGPTDTEQITGHLSDLLRGADVVVLLAPAADLAATLTTPVAERRARIVASAQAITAAAAAVGAGRLVAVTSAMVLGASAENPIPLPDDAPVLALADVAVVGDLVEVEQVLSRVPQLHPGLALTVLRPAALVGPDVDTVVSRHFEAPRLLVLREGETVWQFCHIEDLAEAVAVAIAGDLDGPLTVGAPGVLTQAAVEHLSGMRRLVLSESLARGTAERLHRVGVLPAPASDLAYVVRPWAVSAQRLLDAGWSPTYDNTTCLGVLLEQVRGHHAVASRRLDRHDAARGAAGAAVALLGTAAIVRRRRRRNGGS